MIDNIEFINKEYGTESTGPPENFVGYTIKHELTKTNLKISQPHLITKINQGINKDVKSLMTFNILDALYKGIVQNK